MDPNRLRSTEISPEINVSKKQKEGSALGKTNKTDDDDDRGDTKAMFFPPAGLASRVLCL